MRNASHGRFFLGRFNRSLNRKFHGSDLGCKEDRDAASRKIASSLRGRSVEAVIYPYSYREFLKSRNINVPRSLRRINKQIRSLLENQLLMYLRNGGFPEAQGLSTMDRHLLLQGYVNTVLFRDVVDRFKVTNIVVMKTLIRHLIRNAGPRFTVNKFYNQLKSKGFKVAKKTLHEYPGYLQKENLDPGLNFAYHNVRIFCFGKKLLRGEINADFHTYQ